ncbi:MAG TPA: hypothetical protein VM933_08280 [Acidimicrobiales bacterium]|nr:hypothetical protein [Acidimicrobiales bacterium]
MRLQLLVLSSTPTESAGVDLGSGALRRVVWLEPPAAVFDPYDVVEAHVLPSDDVPFPNDTLSAVDPVRLGVLRGRRARKLVKPLVHPSSQPLLGAATPTVTYWTLRPEAPSVALVAPAAGPVVERDDQLHLRCRFRWRRLDHDLPLDDPVLDDRLSHPTATRLAGGTLARALGWKPVQLLVSLDPPVEGRCQKVVAGLLPRP